jgi:hypothetical protein
MGPERYRLGEVDWSDSTGGRRAARSRASGVSVTLSAAHAQLLARSGRHRPLGDYAVEWTRRAAVAPLKRLTGWAPNSFHQWLDRSSGRLKPNGAELEAANAQLAELIDAGILVSDASFVQSIASQSPASEPAKISRVGFPTRRRPEALCRAIKSYCENGRSAGRTFEFVIVDDSREEGPENETRDLLVELQAEYAFPMRFAGLAERETFALKLAARSGVDVALARFAVLGATTFPLTTGSVRNCVLLDCVDQPLLMGDDDGVCLVAPWSSQKAGLAFSSAGDPTEFEFFESRDQTRAAAKFAEIDLLAAHEKLLGQSLSQIVRSMNDVPELDRLSQHTEANMMRDGGMVQATMAGVVGDSGIGSSAYLSISEESARRLSQSEEFYAAAVSSRQVIRAAEKPTVGNFTFCMSGNLAIDTRSMPPLFTPVLRNSDGVFGQLLRECHPGAYSGAIPYVVLHDPLEHRSHSLDAWKRDAVHIRYADILLMLLNEWTPYSELTDASTAYSELASHLQDRVGSSPQLTGELQRIARQRSEQRKARFESAATADLPAFYQQLRREGLELMTEVATQPGHVVPRDLREITDTESEAAEAARALTQRMAELYGAWPALWRAAGELAQEGIRLTRAV